MWLRALRHIGIGAYLALSADASTVLTPVPLFLKPSVAAGFLLKPAGFFCPDSVIPSVAIGPMHKPGAVITPIPLFLHASLTARLFFVPACFVSADFMAAPIAAPVWRGMSALPFWMRLLKTRPIVAPIALFLAPAVTPCPLFLAQRILRIDDRIERPDDLIHVLCPRRR
jgi:hypothetical protein